MSALTVEKINLADFFLDKVHLVHQQLINLPSSYDRYEMKYDTGQSLISLWL